MSHDWIFDVLRDLKTYALANGLPATAAGTEDLLHLVQAEIAARGQGGPDAPAGKPH